LGQESRSYYGGTCGYCGGEIRVRGRTVTKPPPPGARDLGITEVVWTAACERCGGESKEELRTCSGCRVPGVADLMVAEYGWSLSGYKYRDEPIIPPDNWLWFHHECVPRGNCCVCGRRVEGECMVAGTQVEVYGLDSDSFSHRSEHAVIKHLNEIQCAHLENPRYYHTDCWGPQVEASVRKEFDEARSAETGTSSRQAKRQIDPVCVVGCAVIWVLTGAVVTFALLVCNMIWGR